MFICTINWWQILPQKDYFQAQDESCRGDGIRASCSPSGRICPPLSEAGPGKAKSFTLLGLREKWVWARWQWTKTTSDTGVGNPSAATAEKGKRSLEAVTVRSAAFSLSLRRPTSKSFTRRRRD